MQTLREIISGNDGMPVLKDTKTPVKILRIKSSQLHGYKHQIVPLIHQAIFELFPNEFPHGTNGFMVHGSSLSQGSSPLSDPEHQQYDTHYSGIKYRIDFAVPKISQ